MFEKSRKMSDSVFLSKLNQRVQIYCKLFIFSKRISKEILFQR